MRQNNKKHTARLLLFGLLFQSLFFTRLAYGGEAPSKLSKAQRYQLLYYATFGPQPESYQALEHLGYSSWLEKQFSLPETLHETVFLNDEQPESPGKRENIWWKVIISREDQLRQRIAFALSEIFVVSRFGGGLNKKAHSLTNYYDVLVKNAFGNYRQLLQEVTLHPAMGRYLSMMGSRKANTTKGTYPDENYAREVMQLFSIGLYQLNTDGSKQLTPEGDYIPSYTQTDVEDAARAFSGWVKAKNDSALIKPMRSVPGRHDYGVKTILGVKLPAGQSPLKDVSQTLDILFNHPNTPPYISRLLIKRLVTSNPSPAYIKRVSEVFSDNGKGVRGDLKAVLKAILLDEEALGLSDEKPIKVKEPVIAFANIQRALYPASIPDNNKVTRLFKGLQQGPLMSPSVFNFFDPEYKPSAKFSEYNLVSPELELMNWVSYITYSNIIRAALFDKTKENIVLDINDFINLANQPKKFVALINKRFFAESMSDRLKNTLLIHLSESNAKPVITARQTLHLALISDEFLVQE